MKMSLQLYKKKKEREKSLQQEKRACNNRNPYLQYLQQQIYLKQQTCLHAGLLATIVSPASNCLSIGGAIEVQVYGAMYRAVTAIHASISTRQY